MAEIDRLYHYTTADGLIGIVNTSSLWATSVFYLNDSRELVAAVELARSWLTQRREAANRDIESDRIDWLLGDNLRYLGEPFTSKPVFVCSFTREPDQLSQWRAYCQGGGFAIGFPKELLEEAVTPQQFALHECVYSHADQSSLVEGIVAPIVRPWLESAELRVNDNQSRFLVSNKLVWELLRHGSRIKDPSFAEERESRIISQPEWKYEPVKLRYRSRKGLVVPYTTVSLPDDSDFWGKVRVVVGPTPYPEESKASAYDLVRRYRMQVIKVDISCVPYREM